MSNCPPRFFLVQLTTGDLSGNQLKEIERHIESCPRCKAKLAALRKNVDTFEKRQDLHLAKLKQQLSAEKTPHNVPQKQWRWKWIPVIVTPIAAAAVLLLVMLRPGPEISQPDSFSFKGNFTVKIVAKRGDDQFVIKNGTKLFEGDALRFILTAAAAGYVTVFLIDARFKSTPFYPESNPALDITPYRLAKKGKEILPGSIILDSSIGREQIVVAFSEKTFRRDELHQKIIHIIKEEGPAAVNAKRVGIPVMIFAIQKVVAR